MYNILFTVFLELVVNISVPKKTNFYFILLFSEKYTLYILEKYISRECLP